MSVAQLHNDMCALVLANKALQRDLQEAKQKADDGGGGGGKKWMFKY